MGVRARRTCDANTVRILQGKEIMEGLWKGEVNDRTLALEALPSDAMEECVTHVTALQR